MGIGIVKKKEGKRIASLNKKNRGRRDGRSQEGK